MKRMTKPLVVAVVCLLGASVLAPTADAATDVPWTDDNRSLVRTAGSDTAYFLMNKIALAYNETEGCFQTAVQAPLTATSPQQEQCLGATVPQGPSGPQQANAVKTENYDHDIVVNIFPQGSNAGRRQLCLQLGAPDGTRDPRVPGVDIARSSAGPSEGFQCTGATARVNGVQLYPAGQRVLRFIAYARDGLTWSYWETLTGGSKKPGGPSTGYVTNLTQAQLNGIYVTCTITNWSQVGGANKPIIVWTAIPGSGTRSSWDTFVGGNSDNCIPAQFKDGSLANGERVIREHFAQPVEEAVNDPAAADEGDSIYPFGVGPWNTSPAQRQNAKLGGVNGVPATGENVSNGTFPFARLLYNVIIQSGPSPRASAAVRRFTNARTYVPGQPGALGDPQQLGYLCKPLSAHSKPIGDPGPGIESALASKNYGIELRDVILANGVFPLTTDPNAARCEFADYRVNQDSMDLVS